MLAHINIDSIMQVVLVLSPQVPIVAEAANKSYTLVFVILSTKYAIIMLVLRY